MTKRQGMPSGNTSVAVWSTGAIGSIAIRSVLRRPELELTGVWVHSEAKVGLDIGDLVGVEPIGQAATNDVETIIAARPDVVLYAASGPELDAVNVPVYVRLLSSGINVVTVSSPALIYPAAADAAIIGQLRAAAVEGGATFYASGLEPGFAADHLIALLTSMSDEVTSVRTQELFRYDTYANEFLMRDVFGFGRPMDFTALMQLDGTQAMAWAGPIHYVAAMMGTTVDEIRETYDRRETERDLDVACGRIEAGTCGAVRLETIGVIDGRDAIIIEHVNRMADDIAPDWPTAHRDGIYRVLIEGQPSMTCELAFGAPEEAGADGMVATAMRIVNAATYVAQAPAGLLSSLDLPITIPHGALRR